MPDIARQWFVPGDGIDRHVISADIQRYLGNDATVRPGLGNGENQGVQGYWIKAYRNLTSAMISDLQQDSARWRQEQQRTGSREYAGSTTYNASSAGRTANSRNSPSIDGPYGLPARERIPADRMSADRIPVDRMQMDQPIGQPVRGGYPSTERPYPVESRTYGQGERGYMPEGRSPYPQDSPMTAPYGQRAPPVAAPYDQARYAPDYHPGNGAPVGYPSRQGEYMAPSGQYDPPPAPGRTGNQFGPGGYGQQPAPIRGAAREHGYTQPEYNDPRYAAYPSPAVTVSTVAARESASSPPQQQSAYGTARPQQYDPYDTRRKFR